MFSSLPESPSHKWLIRDLNPEKSDFWEPGLNWDISVHIAMRPFRMLARSWKLQREGPYLYIVNSLPLSLFLNACPLKLLSTKCWLTLPPAADELWREPASLDKIIIAQICLVWGKGTLSGKENGCSPSMGDTPSTPWYTDTKDTVHHGDMHLNLKLVQALLCSQGYLP